MKFLFIVLLVMILSFSTSRAQELYSVEACFESYAQGTYCFVDMEGTTYEFQDMEASAMEKYDLTDGSYQGRMFTVVYRVEISVYEEEEEDNREQGEYWENIIVDLEIVG